MRPQGNPLGVLRPVRPGQGRATEATRGGGCGLRLGRLPPECWHLTDSLLAYARDVMNQFNYEALLHQQK